MRKSFEPEPLITTSYWRVPKKTRFEHEEIEYSHKISWKDFKFRDQLKKERDVLATKCEGRNLIPHAPLSRFSNVEDDNDRAIVTLLVHHSYSDGEGKIIWAHCGVLEQKSVAFRALLNSDLPDEERKTINIWNVRYPVMRAVVMYCYTQEICFTNDILPIDVAVIADKLELHSLMAICETTVCESINQENLLDVMKLLERCHLGKVKKAVEEFVQTKLQGM